MSSTSILVPIPTAIPTPTPTSTSIISPTPPTTESKAKKARSPNWTPAEEEQLAISWLHVSQLPEFISNQTSETFYARVTEHFGLYSKIHPRDPDQVRVRSVSILLLITETRCLHYFFLSRATPHHLISILVSRSATALDSDGAHSTPPLSNSQPSMPPSNVSRRQEHLSLTGSSWRNRFTRSNVKDISSSSIPLGRHFETRQSGRLKVGRHQLGLLPLVPSDIRSRTL